MTVLQAALLVMLAITSTAVVLRRDPLRQTLVAGIYGLLLGLLFFAFQAPDVALSEIVVGTFVIPTLVILALGKVAEKDQ